MPAVSAAVRPTGGAAGEAAPDATVPAQGAGQAVPTPTTSAEASGSLQDSQSQPKPAAPAVRPPVQPGRSLLSGSISINAVAIPKVEVEKIAAEVKPLEQGDLERYWKEAGEELGLAKLLGDARVRLGERRGMVEVDAKTTYFHEEFKEHKTAVVEVLRKKSGMKMLECKVNQLFATEEELAYAPEVKYKTMLQTNSNMQSMRKLFPNIDY